MIATTNPYLMDDQLATFWQQGYLLLEGILTPEEIAPPGGRF